MEHGGAKSAHGEVPKLGPTACNCSSCRGWSSGEKDSQRLATATRPRGATLGPAGEAKLGLVGANLGQRQWLLEKAVENDTRTSRTKYASAEKHEQVGRAVSLPRSPRLECRTAAQLRGLKWAAREARKKRRGPARAHLMPSIFVAPLQRGRKCPVWRRRGPARLAARRDWRAGWLLWPLVAVVLAALVSTRECVRAAGANVKIGKCQQVLIRTNSHAELIVLPGAPRLSSGGRQGQQGRQRLAR